MRITRFQDAGGEERCGRIDEGEVAEFAGLTFTQWLEAGAPHNAAVERRFALADVRPLPPIAASAKVFCVGYNYASHGAEMERDVPAHPTVFLRFPDSLVGSGTPVRRPPESPQLDWEGEVGVIIGAQARRVPRHLAHHHVAGYTLVADNSVRDWQFHSNQATAGKNWPASGACGPWLTTPDEAGTGPWLLETRLNGEVKQRASTADLVFDVPALISYLSTFTVLRPGDLIATGTPAGIGYREDPPRFLRPGDRLEVRAEELGLLVNDVVDEITASTESA